LHKVVDLLLARTEEVIDVIDEHDPIAGRGGRTAPADEHVIRTLRGGEQVPEMPFRHESEAWELRGSQWDGIHRPRA